MIGRTHIAKRIKKEYYRVKNLGFKKKKRKMGQKKVRTKAVSTKDFN